MPEQKRFLDRGALLAGFAKQCLAVCPKCAGLMIVVSNSKYAVPFRSLDSKATCTRCTFRANGIETPWNGPSKGEARGRCNHCGFKWLTYALHRNSSKRLPSSTRVSCPACLKVSSVSIQWEAVRFGGPYEPSFGFPLLLQTTCRGETLWVFNRDHLVRLREYVSASLRERRGFTYSPNLHWSVFSRLPKWLSAAGNRASVLACLQRLEQMFPRDI